MNQTGSVLIEIHRFYSFVHLLCTDHVLRYHSGFSWITLAFNTEPNKEGIWNEQFLRWSPFISNCPHCTVPASQILLRSFFSRCASFLISLPPSFFLFLSHAILPSAILLALLFLLPLPSTPPHPFLPRSPTFLGGFCARCILRRSALPRSLPFHFVQLLQALECRIMSFVASGCSYL